MSGNGGNAASNAAARSAGGENEPLSDLVRPSPNDTKAFRKWSDQVMYEDAPDGWTKLVVYQGIAARFSINAWLGIVGLDPRCRDRFCDFHAMGKQCRGVACGRGQAGSGEFGVKFARGPVYASSDNSRANQYGEDAIRNDFDEKIGYVTLTAVILIPTTRIYTTFRDHLLNNSTKNRNFWWKDLGFKMIKVTDSIGSHVTGLSSYDIALMDISYFHITRCIPSHNKAISPENGLAWLTGHDGVAVIDAQKALKVGIFGTKEIAADALKNSTKPWDLHDVEVAKVYVRACVCSLCALCVCWPPLCL